MMPILEIGGLMALTFAWLRIALSPVAMALIPATLAWVGLPWPWGVMVAIPTLLLGIALGAAWAERWRRREKLIHFVSQIYASPDLDDLPPIESGRRE